MSEVFPFSSTMIFNSEVRKKRNNKHVLRDKGAVDLRLGLNPETQLLRVQIASRSYMSYYLLPFRLSPPMVLARKTRSAGRRLESALASTFHLERVGS